MDNPGAVAHTAGQATEIAGGGAPELPDRPGDMQSLTTTGGVGLGGMNAVGGWCSGVSRRVAR